MGELIALGIGFCAGAALYIAFVWLVGRCMAFNERGDES